MIVKAFFWGLVISCGTYYAYLEYTPFDSNASLKAQVPLAPMPIPASTEPMRIPEPPKVVPM